MRLDTGFLLNALGEAREVLAARIHRTPLVYDPDTKRAPILLKCENLQWTGSCKIRGAAYRMAGLSPAERARGIVTYSDGNHAVAVASAARDTGTAAVVVMSRHAAPQAVAAVRRYGGSVVMIDSGGDAGRAVTRVLAAEGGYVLIDPSDDLDVVLGQGTIGLEILDQMSPGEDFAVFVPLGAGALLAGIALAVKQSWPKAQVIGVKLSDGSRFASSLSFDRRLCQEVPELGISGCGTSEVAMVRTLGELPSALVERYVDKVAVVSDSEIVDAVLLAHDRMHLVVEPLGILAYAAARRFPPRSGGAVAVLSGGNVSSSYVNELRAVQQEHRLSLEADFRAGTAGKARMMGWREASL